MKQTSLHLPVLNPFNLTFRVTNVIDTILMWHERSYQRHLLAEMDDRMLRDIGLEPGDVLEETAKPFWKA
jgi:uncharacterized protein YjiS (DUF1127 family)